jgi:hypothetical protein
VFQRASNKALTKTRTFPGGRDAAQPLTGKRSNVGSMWTESIHPIRSANCTCVFGAIASGLSSAAFRAYIMSVRWSGALLKKRPAPQERASTLRGGCVDLRLVSDDDFVCGNHRPRNHRRA